MSSIFAKKFVSYDFLHNIPIQNGKIGYNTEKYTKTRLKNTYINGIIKKKRRRD